MHVNPFQTSGRGLMTTAEHPSAAKIFEISAASGSFVAWPLATPFWGAAWPIAASGLHRLAWQQAREQVVASSRRMAAICCN